MDELESIFGAWKEYFPNLEFHAQALYGDDFANYQISVLIGGEKEVYRIKAESAEQLKVLARDCITSAYMRMIDKFFDDAWENMKRG